MKLYFKVYTAMAFMSLISSFYCHSQELFQADSVNLKYKLKQDIHDTIRVNTLNAISDFYKFRRADSTFHYGQKALLLARKINYPQGEASALSHMSVAANTNGNGPNAVYLNLEGLKIAEKHGLEHNIAILTLQLGFNYHRWGQYNKAFEALHKSITRLEKLNNTQMVSIALSQIALIVNKRGNYDSAIIKGKEAVRLAESTKSKLSKVQTLNNLAIIHRDNQNYEKAIPLFHEVISINKTRNTDTRVPGTFHALAELYNEKNSYDSAIFYSKKALNISEKEGYLRLTEIEHTFLSKLYAEINTDSALHYSQLALVTMNTINSMNTRTSIEGIIELNDRERDLKMQMAIDEYENKTKTNIYLGGILLLFIIAFFLYRNNKLKQKSKDKIEKAFHELKSTQTQLIHSEKMASLGELTAGIAHEIQNPLNFVNNFSEVSNELIEEMLEEIKNGDLEEAGAIAEDVKQNLTKINHHGQRAADIVRSMLQHSRGSNNIKEPTDLNALCDEYLRLAYHGLRAKNKSFNAEMVTNFDDSIGKITVIPQDIGRVLLNLITNAFYAASRGGTSSALKPLVSITTKKSSNTITISVSDNGPGIPDEIKDKIFQPFFTTKPAGQGTGLGLSMSFDLIRAHGGEIRVDSRLGQGATFTVILIVPT